MKTRQFWAAFAVLLLFALYAWHDITYWPPPGPYTLRLMGHLLAVLGLTFIFMQFVLISRAKFLEKALGRKNMLNYHRLFGKTGILLIFLHAVLILAFQGLAFGRINLHLFMVIGIISLAGFFAIAVKYMKWGMAYKTWRNIHRANYIIYPLSLVHVFSNAYPGSLLYYLWSLYALGYGAVVIYKLYRWAIDSKKQPSGKGKPSR